MTVDKTVEFPTGAKRSSDSDLYDWTSLPVIGLFSVARTAHEGALKYGRYNYVKGFPIHVLLNHSLTHIFSYIAGNRDKRDIEHAIWNLLDVVQQDALNPELSNPHLLGPGMTLTPEVLNELEKHKRQEDEDWITLDLPVVQDIIEQRNWNAVD